VAHEVLGVTAATVDGFEFVVQDSVGLDVGHKLGGHDKARSLACQLTLQPFNGWPKATQMDIRQSRISIWAEKWRITCRVPAAGRRRNGW
jgi:hypothetical protein